MSSGSIYPPSIPPSLPTSPDLPPFCLCSMTAVWVTQGASVSVRCREKCTLWGQHCRVTWVTVCFHFNLLYSTQRWRWVEVWGGGGGTVHRQRQDREERTNPFLVAKAELQLTRTCLASEDELWWGERELQDDWSRDGWGACVCSTWTWVCDVYVCACLWWDDGWGLTSPQGFD